MKSIPHLVYIVTVPITARAFLHGQVAYLRDRGFRITVISSPGDDLAAIAASDGVETLAVPMEREIAPLADLRSFWRLYCHLRRLRPTIVNASTPKAGLLGMLTARLVGVPVRVYQLRGLRLETLAGAKRRISALSERIASACAHRVICNSGSLRESYVKAGFAPARKAVLLGSGSSNGIDAARFLPSPAMAERAAMLRRELDLASDDPVIGFVGRFTRDKGIVELLDTFDLLLAQHPSLRLLLLGRFEDGDPLPEAEVRRLNAHPRIHQAGFVTDTAPYYHLMTVFAFPSHREGFPNAPLEAAVAGVPTVAFRATGTVDTIIDGETGLLVPVGNARALADAIGHYLDDPELRAAHGRAGRERAVSDFAREVVWEAMHREYRGLLERYEHSAGDRTAP